MQHFWRRWRALWHPDRYHGWGRERRYFEGWYYKLVSPDGSKAVAIIPGISRGADAADQHAFIQLLDGKACRTFYYRFPVADFQPSSQEFALQLGPNYFSRDTLRLDLPDLQGELALRDFHPWPRSLGAPGIMGWYSFVPFMECYHGVVSLHHQLEGQLTLYNESIDFTGGIGYGEKDWGRSFPSSWIWMQSNHFGLAEPTSLMVSIARIPWLGSHFVGYIAGFLFQGHLYRFATYLGTRLEVLLIGRRVEIRLTNRHYRLEVSGQPAEGGNLVSPIQGQMTGKVNESLQGQLHIRFFLHDELAFEGTGQHAGLELAGPVEEELAGQV
ncbi:MAG: hypothetical protein KDC54_10735 [Lewinella sp.]|nr:hypothetical protein [Lewinella sp.]